VTGPTAHRKNFEYLMMALMIARTNELNYAYVLSDDSTSVDLMGTGYLIEC
jgi:hypothetical protein